MKMTWLKGKMTMKMTWLKGIVTMKMTWLKGTSRHSFLQNMFLGSMQASYTIHLVLVVIMIILG